MLKVETGRPRLKSVSFDLPCLLEDIVKSKIDQAAAKCLKITSLIDPAMPVMARGDPDSLHQLLMSLVGYAINCADHGDIFVQAGVEKETASASSVVFSISFNGTAAFIERQQALQESLDSADDSLIAEFDGIDSELNISRQLLLKMGSTLQMVNNLGKGSRLTFTIKFKRDATVTKDVHVTKSEPAPDFKGIRILVVDDNPTSRQDLTKMLAGMGCGVKAVASSVEVRPALVRGLITNAPYRIVLLDLGILVMGGEDVLQLFHQDELTRNTKVILLVSTGNRNKLDNISRSDYSNILLKPVRPSDLSNALASTLGIRQDIPRENNSMMTERVAGSRDGHNLKILLVEDDELNLKMGNILFSHLGHTVDLASGGAEALAKLETRNYDLVFMDVQMPQMNGLEATRRIRALKNDSKKVPIIAMTAHDTSKYEKLCLEAGMDDYLSKPFNINRINQIVTAYAAGRYGKRLKSIKPPETLQSPVDAPPILDVTVGMSIFENDVKQFGNFLKEYQEGLPKRLERMGGALNLKDWSSLENEAHNLKGISANLGVVKISHLAARLEVQSKERIEKPVHSTLSEITEAISELADQAPGILSPIKSDGDIHIQ